MPKRAPRICGCGQVIPEGETCCPCEAKRKASAEANRPNAHERGYDHRWREAAKAFLSRHLHCAHCDDYATVVDHVIPHRGNPKLFWDQSNWQALCAHCHNSAKQARERRKQSRFSALIGCWR